jgi:hypothetical protein
VRRDGRRLSACATRSWGEWIRPLARTWRRLEPDATGGDDELASGRTQVGSREEREGETLI